MVRQIEEVLTEMGWTDGFRIPVANEENKKLEAEVEEKMKQKAKYILELEELNDRVDALNRHTKSVENEHKENQAIITAHKIELDTENDMVRLAEAENSKLKQDLKQINKAFTDLGERHTSLQNDIIFHTGKLDKLKEGVKIDKEMLLAWEEELSRSEENNNLLQRYMDEDESKAKELDVKREHLQLEVDTRKKLVKDVVGQVSMLESELDSTAQMFRRVHLERQSLILRWEEAVLAHSQRDADIEQASMDILATQLHIRDLITEKEDHMHFYENECNNSREVELQISHAILDTQHYRKKNLELENEVDDINSELCVLQRTMSNTGVILGKQRSRNKQLQVEIKEKENKILVLGDILTSIKNRYDEVMNKWSTASQRTKHIEEILENEEKASESLKHDVAKILQMTYKSTLEHDNLKANIKLQESEINTLTSHIGVLEKLFRKLQNDMHCQNEILYNMDFEMQSLESRIDYLNRGSSPEEREMHNKKIIELELILSEKMATFHLLQSQVQHLEETMRKLTNGLESDSEELKRLVDRRQDQMLLVEGGHKQLANSRKNNLDRQVEENILKLRVNQLEAAMKKEGNAVYSMEKQRLELEAAMKERQLEIGMHMDLFKAKQRALNEEKSLRTRDLLECKIKISQLQKKYDLAIQLLGKDESGEQMSVTHIKIKSSQEKFMLQKEGDELDTKIRKSEKEILAMENTLKVINATNDTYKKNLSSVDMDGPEFIEKKELEKQYYTAIDRQRSCRTQLAEIKSEIRLVEKNMEELLQAEDELRNKYREKDQDAVDLDREMHEQQIKLVRADKQQRRLIKELRGVANPKVLTIEERDINLRELQEQNKSALQQLAELVARRIETGPVVVRYLNEKNLDLPQSLFALTPAPRARQHTRTTPQASSSMLSVISGDSTSPSIVDLNAALLGTDTPGARTPASTSSSEKKKQKEAKKPSPSNSQR